MAPSPGSPPRLPPRFTLACRAPLPGAARAEPPPDREPDACHTQRSHRARRPPTRIPAPLDDAPAAPSDRPRWSEPAVARRHPSDCRSLTIPHRSRAREPVQARRARAPDAPSRLAERCPTTTLPGARPGFADGLLRRRRGGVEGGGKVTGALAAAAQRASVALALRNGLLLLCLPSAEASRRRRLFFLASAAVAFSSSPPPPPPPPPQGLRTLKLTPKKNFPLIWRTCDVLQLYLKSFGRTARLTSPEGRQRDYFEAEFFFKEEAEDALQNCKIPNMTIEWAEANISDNPLTGPAQISYDPPRCDYDDFNILLQE
nr:CASP-like protein 4U1 [Aegilops tauschii subsp. strangulata]